MSKQTASRSKKKSASAMVQICSVRVGQGAFGIPIRHILEIVGSARPQPVPLAPGFVGGLVHYRGDVLTTVSLRQLLGMSPVEGTQDILVLESPGGCYGLLVDSVNEVLTISVAELEANPSTLDDSHRKLFAGAYKLKNNLLVMLDPAKLDPIQLGAAAA
jgi:purine-binding chemotaxis protein CheW